MKMRYQASCHRGLLEDTLGAKAETAPELTPTREGAVIFIHQFPATHGLKAAPKGCQFSSRSKLPPSQTKWSLAAREHYLEAGSWQCVKWGGGGDINGRHLSQHPKPPLENGGAKLYIVSDMLSLAHLPAKQIYVRQ